MPIVDSGSLCQVLREEGPRAVRHSQPCPVPQMRQGPFGQLSRAKRRCESGFHPRWGDRAGDCASDCDGGCDDGADLNAITMSLSVH